MNEYLKSSDIIDWQHPTIVGLARTLENRALASQSMEGAALEENQRVLSRVHTCFEWVRDEIRHSVDYRMNPVTCRASDVLHHRTGYCYAKSHLLAALLRALQIPAGFCYQRLSIDDQGAPYSLHGLNAVYLPKIGWYRIDARGNRAGVDAQFTPPHEQLAFPICLPEEADFEGVLPDPLPIVVETLTTQKTWDGALKNLPDLKPEAASDFGLSVRI